jgi:hypothetical protein
MASLILLNRAASSSLGDIVSEISESFSIERDKSTAGGVEQDSGDEKGDAEPELSASDIESGISNTTVGAAFLRFGVLGEINFFVGDVVASDAFLVKGLDVFFNLAGSASAEPAAIFLGLPRGFFGDSAGICAEAGGADASVAVGLFFRGRPRGFFGLTAGAEARVVMVCIWPGMLDGPGADPIPPSVIGCLLFQH